MFIGDMTIDSGMRRALLIFVSDVATDECMVCSSVLKTDEHDLNLLND
jgi:hypothetical protein